VREASCESMMGPYTVRRFCSDDAAGVTRLVEGVYGDTYYPPQLYNPDEIVHLNAAEKLVYRFIETYVLAVPCVMLTAWLENRFVPN
jgi:hypothetical protein